jgi:serine/threonine-protein kinase
VSQSEEHPRPEGEAYCPTCDRSFESTTRLCPEDGTRLVDLSRPTDPMIGREIDGRFTIRERLGAGGMGVVYRAWQASVGREVAIKVISPRPGDDSSTSKRFLREAKLASQLAQPNIVMVIDFGATHDGTLYLAMELLRGRTLSQAWRKDGPFSPRRMLRVASQLCDALDSAHRAGIVHRDLKPANVMILDDPTGRDFLKVLDFGLAKALDGEHDTTQLTQSDRVVGTPSYMAPEVITGAKAGPQSDLYSVGVVLFEMLTGKLPFAAPNANVMLAKHAYAPVPELGDEVPVQVAYVVKKLLAKRPEQRYATAARLRDALEAAVAGTLEMEESAEAFLDTAATPMPVSKPHAVEVDTQSTTGTAPTAAAGFAVTPEPTTMRPSPKRRWGLAIAALLLAGGGGAAIAIMSRDDGTRAPATAPARTPLDARAASTTPRPAITPDAGVAPVDAAVEAPVDAGTRRKKPPRPPKLDAGVRSTPTPPPDAGAKPPPPRKIDAGPTWVDPT